jgi:hypothetical protein
MFAIVTSALTSAIVLAAPVVGAAAAPIRTAEPVRNQLPIQDIPATAAAALEETSDLFGNLGRDLEETLSAASLSTDADKPTTDSLNTKSDPLSPKNDPLSKSDPLGTKNDETKNEAGKDLFGISGIGNESDLQPAMDTSRLSQLVGRTAQSVVNGVDDVIGSLD